MTSTRVVLLATVLGLIALGLIARPVAAEEENVPVFKIEMRDGVIEPPRLEVPANTRFKLEIHNTGQTPVEFESVELKKEKVLPGQSASSMVFRRLDPGEYNFFDDFHPDAKAVIVAK